LANVRFACKYRLLDAVDNVALAPDAIAVVPDPDIVPPDHDNEPSTFTVPDPANVPELNVNDVLAATGVVPVTVTVAPPTVVGPSILEPCANVKLPDPKSTPPYEPVDGFPPSPP
jgi:hypothetical protein